MYTAIKDYLKDLATHHPDIAHTDAKPAFFTSLAEGMAAYKGHTFSLPMMCMFASNFGYGNDYDAVVRKEYHDVWILDSVKPKDYDKRFQVIANCTEIAEKLIARIVNDRAGYQTQIAQCFNLLETEIEPVGQTDGELYGVSVKLAWDMNHALDYDASEWLDT